MTRKDHCPYAKYDSRDKYIRCLKSGSGECPFDDDSECPVWNEEIEYTGY